MNVKEYGTQNREIIMLLHGGGFSWWNYREAAEILKERFHVVLPILDGHSGSDRGFTSIEDNAAEIISFTDENFGGRVFLIGGVSLGGQILLDILSQRKDICKAAFVESASAIPSKLTNAMISPAFGMSYGLVKKEWFARAQFNTYKLKDELFEDYFRDTKAISKKDMIAFLQANQGYSPNETLKDTQANVYIFAGSNEIPQIKKSAVLLHKLIPNSTLEFGEGLYHGQLPMNRPEQYAEKIMKIYSETGDTPQEEQCHSQK